MSWKSLPGSWRACCVRCVSERLHRRLAGLDGLRAVAVLLVVLATKFVRGAGWAILAMAILYLLMTGTLTLILRVTEKRMRIL